MMKATEMLQLHIHDTIEGSNEVSGAGKEAHLLGLA